MVDLIGGIFQVARQELENTESARGVKSASSSESVNPAGYWVTIHRTDSKCAHVNRIVEANQK